MKLADFAEIVFVDFEFIARDGERVQPVCFVARQLRSGRLSRYWFDGNVIANAKPDFPLDRETLLVAYYSSAELGCFRALGWRDSAWVCDLYAEFRTQTNGMYVPCGTSLMGALSFHGLDPIAGSKKDALRRRIMQGGPFSAEERTEILRYCEEDVEALVKLFPN